MPTWLRSHPSLAAFHLGSLAGEEEEKEPVVDPESVGVDTAAGGGLSEINITLEKIPSCLVCARPPAMEANSDRWVPYSSSAADPGYTSRILFILPSCILDPDPTGGGGVVI
jgi:hypothetical protein